MNEVGATFSMSSLSQLNVIVYCKLTYPAVPKSKHYPVNLINPKNSCVVSFTIKIFNFHARF